MGHKKTKTPALAAVFALAFAAIVHAQGSSPTQPADTLVDMQVQMAALTLDNIEVLKDRLVVLQQAELAIELVNVDAELFNTTSFSSVRLMVVESGIDVLVNETNAAIETLNAELAAMPADAVEAARKLPVPPWRLDQLRADTCSLLARLDESKDSCYTPTE